MTSVHKEWCDLGIRISDSEQVLASVQLFEMLWTGRIRKFRKLPPSVRARGSLFHRLSFFRQFIRQLVSVDQQFRAMTAYFVPKRSFMLALLFLSEKRKVDVELLIPDQTDHPFTRWIAQAYIERLIRGGVHVFSLPHRFLHAKAVAFDRDVWMGSTNLNYRSLQHDLELDYQVRDSAALHEWEEFWTQLKSESNPWTLERVKAIPLWERVLGLLLLRFRYWC